MATAGSITSAPIMRGRCSIPATQSTGRSRSAPIRCESRWLAIAMGRLRTCGVTGPFHLILKEKIMAKWEMSSKFYDRIERAIRDLEEFAEEKRDQMDTMSDRWRESDKADVVEAWIESIEEFVSAFDELDMGPDLS